ncbi:uncharacterized protein UTRI_06216 [Ustilago trichophora]|uniref:Effector family protein Eff1 n=1 Tax=Ustilago trichophora TaxID=86804 RepID=A0A5C3EHQ0_9BASI|nr:uncharacterized protein UTRI_06216 [Ustilago trichophora]
MILAALFYLFSVLLTFVEIATTIPTRDGLDSDIYSSATGSSVRDLPATAQAIGNPSTFVPRPQLHHFQLFGEPVNPVHPPPRADPSSSRRWYVTYSPEEPPVLNRHLAGMVGTQIYRGHMTAVPEGVFYDGYVRERLKHWVEWLLEHSERRYYYHEADENPTGKGWTTYKYVYDPMSPEDFTVIFPGASFDWRHAFPVAVLRIPPQTSQSHKRIEIAGVEMVTRMYPPLEESLIPKASLSEILDLAGPHAVI